MFTLSRACGGAWPPLLVFILPPGAEGVGGLLRTKVPLLLFCDVKVQLVGVCIVVLTTLLVVREKFSTPRESARSPALLRKIVVAEILCCDNVVLVAVGSRKIYF